jgi:hypothetical protein
MEDDSVEFRKKTTVVGKQATEGGVIETERGPMAYAAGDWLLTTTTGTPQTWPVSQAYLDENYERV